MVPDPRAAHSGELANHILLWEMETEPGSGSGAIAERSPGVRQKIMMAVFKLSSEDSEKAGGRDRKPKWRELLL